MRLLDRAVSAVMILLGRIITVVVALMLLAPILLTIVLSFADDSVIRFPPQSWGVDRYVELFTSEVWLSSLLLSIQLGVVSASIAFLVSLAGLQAVLRSRLPFRNLIEQVSIASLLLPVTAYGVALFAMFAQLRIVGSFWGLALAHAMLAIPFVIIVGGIGLRNVPQDLELVAVTLGASRMRAWFGITVRIAAASLVAGFVMAFLASFEEAVVVSFVGGANTLTLPKRILDALQWGSEPVITAVAAVVTVAVSVLVAVPLAISRGKRK